jgi:hypothetical protein
MSLDLASDEGNAVQAQPLGGDDNPPQTDCMVRRSVDQPQPDARRVRAGHAERRPTYGHTQENLLRPGATE